MEVKEREREKSNVEKQNEEEEEEAVGGLRWESKRWKDGELERR